MSFTQGKRWPPNLVAGMEQALEAIFVNNLHADKTIERAFKANKKWGGRDRKLFAETIYDFTRWFHKLSAWDSKDSLRQKLALYVFWKFKTDPNQILPFFADVSELEKGIQKELEPWEVVSFPRWLYDEIKADYPENFDTLLDRLNEPAFVFLRPNTLKTSPEELVLQLKDESIEVMTSANTQGALKLLERQNVFITKAFKAGLFEVQDEASQKIAPLLNPKPGERIADVCAGAGGKTLHLSALMQNKGSLLAGDVSDRKLDELKKRARRAGVSNLRVVSFKSSKDVKRLSGTFDGVLIDAPCTGTGVIRRNPDIKCKLTKEDLSRLLQLQLEILETYSKLVKPGGRLLYVTCSVLRKENEAQVDRFLASHPNFEAIEAPLKTRPDLTGEDGFFAQLFLKKNS